MDKIYVDLDNDSMNFEEEFKPFLDEEVKDPSIQTKPIWRDEDVSPYDIMEASSEETEENDLHVQAVWGEHDKSPYDTMDNNEDSFDKVKERIKEYGEQHVWKDEDQSPYDIFDDSIYSGFDDPYDEMINEDEFCKDCSNYDTCSKRQNNQPQHSQMQQMDDEIETNINASEDVFADESIQIDSDEYDCIHEADMYDNGNIDWHCGIDYSNSSSQRSLNEVNKTTMPKSITYEKKTMVEENDPPKKTTSWIRVIKEY